jgi:general secretion pathway protein A
MISEDFGIPPKRSQIAQMSAIEEFLTNNYQAGKTTIVFVDEAQRLPLETLELMRSLLNFETDTHKLAQFVVAGQLELRDRLLKRQYEAFRSRIVAPIVMQPLTMEETRNMIQFRLESWDIENPFSPEALAAIYSISGGIPREIILLCQHSCDSATSDGKRTRLVTVEDVQEAHKALAITDPEQLTESEVPAYESVQ